MRSSPVWGWTRPHPYFSSWSLKNGSASSWPLTPSSNIRPSPSWRGMLRDVAPMKPSVDAEICVTEGHSRKTPKACFASLVDLLRHRAREQPYDRAYIFLSDRGNEEAQLTFADLQRQAQALAASLLNRA